MVLNVVFLNRQTICSSLTAGLFHVHCQWLSCCSFEQYAGLVQDKMMPKYAAAWHWAKIEPPAEGDRLAAMQAALATQFPLKQFRQYRNQLDPDNILGNHLLDTLLARS